MAAELDDNAVGIFFADDAHHILERQRLEVQPVRRVVVGADGLGVAVYHYRLDADLSQGEGGVNTAVVKLDALTDAIGPAAEDDDLSPGSRVGLALIFEGRIQVGGRGLEFGSAGVDGFVNGLDAHRDAFFLESDLVNLHQAGHELITKAVFLGLSHQAWAQFGEIGG